MNPFDKEGRNGKESYLLRRVARQRLDEALARRGTYAAALVTALVERIGERQFRESTVERLWATIQSNLERHQSQTVIDSQTGAYGEFRETVRAAFARVEREQRRRIETALRPHTMRRRFGGARLGQGVYVAA
jgi:hypothetical protein